MVQNYFSDTSHSSEEQNNFCLFINLEKLELVALGSYLVLKPNNNILLTFELGVNSGNTSEH